MGSSILPTQFAKASMRAALIALILPLAACSWNEGRSQKIGIVIGGVVGSVVGSQFGSGTGQAISTILGVTLGVMWGEDIVKGLNDLDIKFANRNTQEALDAPLDEDDQKRETRNTWSNPDTGNSGSTSAGKTYQNDRGDDCRDFETTVNVEGESRTANGVACLDPDGTWKIVETKPVETKTVESPT